MNLLHFDTDSFDLDALARTVAGAPMRIELHSTRLLSGALDYLKRSVPDIVWVGIDDLSDGQVEQVRAATPASCSVVLAGQDIRRLEPWRQRGVCISLKSRTRNELARSGSYLTPLVRVTRNLV